MMKLAQRVVVRPLLGQLRRLLRVGATPEQIAWSLAVGLVLGVNPLLGSTTLLVLAVAAIFRLNVVASQLGNHAMYPVEVLLFPVFVKLGSVVFSTKKLPIEGPNLLAAMKSHPWDTTRLLWAWEWHALVVWAAFALLALPALAIGLQPLLRRMMREQVIPPVAVFELPGM